VRRRADTSNSIPGSRPLQIRRTIPGRAGTPNLPNVAANVASMADVKADDCGKPGRILALAPRCHRRTHVVRQCVANP
jgi:hypothetical protein